MRSSSDQIHSFKILRSILGPPMQHLVQRMSHGKGCTLIKTEAFGPSCRSHDLFCPNSLFEVVNTDLRQLVKG